MTPLSSKDRKRAAKILEKALAEMTKRDQTLYDMLSDLYNIIDPTTSEEIPVEYWNDGRN